MKTANGNGKNGKHEATLTVEQWPISRVVAYKNNPRKNEKAIAKVASSIRAFGFRQPIVVDASRTVIAGHTRLMAARELGMATVPVHVAKGLSAAQVKAYRLADNRTAEEAEWDAGLLGLELGELRGLDFDLSLTGFDLAEIAAFMAEPADEESEDVDLTPPKKPKSEEGEMWQLGAHRLICGDGTSADIVQRLMSTDRAGIVLTDPPYGMDLDTDWTSTQGHKYEPVIGDDKPYDPAPIFEHYGYCREMFLWGADYYAERIPNRMAGSWIVWDKREESQKDGIGAEFELCWSKAQHKRRMLRHDWLGFHSSGNSKEARNRLHPTQKPTSLFRDILEQWSKPDAIVADQYAGSGVTIIAAEQTGRVARCAELSPGYCDVIRRRYAEFVNDPSLAP